MAFSLPVAEFGTIGSERIYTIAEVAKELECSERTVRDHIHSTHPGDRLPAIAVGHGRERKDYRILESDLLAFLRRQRTRTLTAASGSAPTFNGRKPEQSRSGVSSDGYDFAARRVAFLKKAGGP